MDALFTGSRGEPNMLLCLLGLATTWCGLLHLCQGALEPMHPQRRWVPTYHTLLNLDAEIYTYGMEGHGRGRQCAIPAGSSRLV